LAGDAAAEPLDSVRQVAGERVRRTQRLADAGRDVGRRASRRRAASAGYSLRGGGLVRFRGIPRRTWFVVFGGQQDHAPRHGIDPAGHHRRADRGLPSLVRFGGLPPTRPRGSVLVSALYAGPAGVLAFQFERVPADAVGMETDG